MLQLFRKSQTKAGCWLRMKVKIAFNNLTAKRGYPVMKFNRMPSLRRIRGSIVSARKLGSIPFRVEFDIRLSSGVVQKPAPPRRRLKFDLMQSLAARPLACCGHEHLQFFSLRFFVHG